MPNNQRPDYISPHKHAGEDIQSGGGVVLIPPTQVAIGVTSDPTRTLGTYATLTDMSITLTPPDGMFKVWEARLVFTGEFTHSIGTGLANIGYQFAVDGVTRGNSTRTVSPALNLAVVGTVSAFGEATVILTSGVPAVLTVQWANLAAGGGTATSVGTSRRFEVSLRPYCPAA